MYSLFISKAPPPTKGSPVTVRHVGAHSFNPAGKGRGGGGSLPGGGGKAAD